MPATEPYSSPFILDLDMSENAEDQDFDFFDPSTPYIASASPTAFLGHNLPAEDKRRRFGSPLTSQKHDLGSTSPFLQSSPQALSTRSLDSPGGSFHDSSSDSSTYKRKSSSESSRSAFTAKDISMSDAEMGDWKMEGGLNGNDTGVYDPYGSITASSSSTTAYNFSDKIMENDFDFDSAASSPNHPAPVMKSPEMPIIKHDTPCRNTPSLNSIAGHHSKPSHNSITQSMHSLTTNNASREASPLSTMVTSHESSPSVFFNNSPSPASGVEFINGTMLSSGTQNNSWSTNYDFGIRNPRESGGFIPMDLNNNTSSAMAFPAELSLMDSMYKPMLTIHPTPLKSRVETQIPIKMTLFPLPPGVTKLHLPTHTISKPKLLAKPPPVKSSDTLELSTTLVCTSAMQNPEFRRRAFARAAGTLKAPESRPDEEADGALDENDENKPLNGGEVKICAGCITRERKRAARKKVKKVEEEESWHKDEDKRVIVFNTQEVKDWQQPSSQVQSDSVGDRREPIVPEGAMQVDAPMRIACYCRHQNEKLGFQVIFTIKDWNDRLVAQEITSSIMITDDHKTHNMPQLLGQSGSAVDGQTFLNNPGIFGPDMGFDMPMGPFRTSHSSSDLQNLQRSYPLLYPTSTTISTPQASQNSSTTITPRNLPRQASPSGSLGPSNKKRKASGSSKVPSGLAMTRLETTQQHAGGQNPANSGAGAVASQSPYTASLGAFASPHDGNFNHLPPSVPPVHPQYITGPPTPNSNDQVFFSNNNRSQSVDNLAIHQLYSAPASAHPSRAPSPNSLRNSVQAYQQQQAQIAHAVANGLYGMPLSLNPHRPPTIHKMIPNEGPKAGGIEVTCLGSGFCQGLEVMFGDIKATTTTYWGETSLVCLLPPATTAGTVAVTFKHQHQQQLHPYPTPPIPKQQAFFKYVDDDEQQIIRTALSVLGHKMTGRMEDVRDLARRIVGDGPSSWGSVSGQSPTGGAQQPPVSGFNAAIFGVNVEATLLRILDLIDLDDSPHLPRLNLRRASGQTMLHLACALGLHRFVAALLARGANPEPRDKGGFTPMHFAAMHNHPQIVRRLMLSGADPTWRTLQGYTPSDLCVSDEVLRVTRRVEHHSRRRSGGSIHSKTSSATSLRSLWEPSSVGVTTTTALPAHNDDLGNDSDIDEGSYEDEDADTAADGFFWMRSRRRTALVPAVDAPIADKASNLAVAATYPTASGLVSPAAAMTAVRDHFAAQIQNLQQSMQHLNLLQMPNLPDYQAYLPTAPMVRRISSLVPHMGASRNSSLEQPPKETDSKWWDLFSGTMPTAPPAYEDIYPQSELDVKRSSAEQATADAMADDKCAVLFDQTEAPPASSSSSAKLASGSLQTLSINSNRPISQEQQAQLQLAHAKKIRFRSDRKLFFIWIPILVIIIAAMLYNRLPKVWAEGNQLISSFGFGRANQIMGIL